MLKTLGILLHLHLTSQQTGEHLLLMRYLDLGEAMARIGILNLMFRLLGWQIKQ